MLKKTRLVSLTLAIALSMAMLPQAAMAKTINWDEEMAKQQPEQYDKTDVNPPAMTPDEHSSADYVDAQGHWFRNSGAMDVALQIGIMHGYDGTHFGPDDYITNAQVLTILYNYTVNQGWTSPDKWSSRNTTWRTDIPDYEYYTKPANWANSHNFLSFIEGDINAPITRGSLMRLVYFYAVFYDTVPVPNYIDDAYKIRDMYRDANNYSGETFYDDQGNSYVGYEWWMVDPVIWATRAGIVSGYPDGTFRPYNRITRAEAAKVIMGGLLSPEVLGQRQAQFAID